MARTCVGCLPGWVLSALLALAFPTGAVAQALSGQAPEEDRFLASEDGWDTYVNGRFGMRLVYPATVFSPAKAPPDGDGRRFEAEDARIEVSAWRNEADVTPSELASQLAEAEGYRNLVRQEVDGARLILSGSRANRVFYEEYHFEGATVQALGMEYPLERRATYEPLVKAIAGSFMPGAETGADEPAEEPGEPPSTVARSADPESSGQAQETGPQAPEPEETAAVDAARPEIAEEPAEEPAAQTAEEPPAQPAEEPAAQPAEAPPAQPVQEPAAQPAEAPRVLPPGHQQETTVPVRRPRVAGSRGEGAGSGAASGGSGADSGGSGADSGGSGAGGGGDAGSGAGDGGAGGGDAGSGAGDGSAGGGDAGGGGDGEGGDGGGEGGDGGGEGGEG